MADQVVEQLWLTRWWNSRWLTWGVEQPLADQVVEQLLADQGGGTALGWPGGGTAFG